MTEIDLTKAVRAFGNQAFSLGRRSTTAIAKQSEFGTLAEQHIYKLFDELVEELAAVKVERNEAICDVNRLCRERPPQNEKTKAWRLGFEDGVKSCYGWELEKPR